MSASSTNPSLRSCAAYSATYLCNTGVLCVLAFSMHLVHCPCSAKRSKAPMISRIKLHHIFIFGLLIHIYTKGRKLNEIVKFTYSMTQILHVKNPCSVFLNTKSGLQICNFYLFFFFIKSV